MPALINWSRSARLRRSHALLLGATVLACVTGQAATFEGRIRATVTRGSETLPILYTVSSNSIRIEVTGATYPHAINLVDRKSGALTMVYPHNRSFTRVPAQAQQDDGRNPPPGFRSPNSRPAGVPGPQSRPAPPNSRGPANFPASPNDLPPGIGPQAGPLNPTHAGSPASMPMPIPSIAEKADLNATTNKTDILGYACTRYDATNRAERLEVWATEKLLPFVPYAQARPAHLGPRTIEDQWPDLLRGRGLFPLRASLRVDHGPDRLRFEVQSIKAELMDGIDETLFQPPPDYHELEPLPF